MADNGDVSEALGREFHPGVLREKPSQGGRKLSYIPSWAVIERLNSVLGLGGWSWRVVGRESDGVTVTVFGELHALGAVYSGEDCADISAKRDGSGRTPDALANAWKSASSGALVRAARLLGVGIYLYRNGKASEVELEERDQDCEAEQPRREMYKDRAEEQPRSPATHTTSTFRGQAPQDGARDGALARSALLARLKAVRERLGWDAKTLVDALCGDPRRIDVTELERLTVELEARVGGEV